MDPSSLKKKPTARKCCPDWASCRVHRARGANPTTFECTATTPALLYARAFLNRRKIILF
jgi:hypothetical protein